mgnify:CR=1 FL=1
MARRKIIAGNWKMNTNAEIAQELVSDIVSEYKSNTPEGVKLVLIPPATFIQGALQQTNDFDHLTVGAQNCSTYKSGAYTGEIAAEMIASLGANYVLVGHSERREYFGETNHQLAEKVNRCLENQLVPVYCCGESLEERKGGTYQKVIEDQIVTALFHLSAIELTHVVIAYEPIWAIGTGETASPAQAQEVHQFIRTLIAESYDQETADEISILYGGSMKPANAKELLAQEDIDGGLIGGASLKANDFLTIAHSY